MLVDGNDKLQAASVGASELNVTPLACCPLRDSEGNQLQLELTVQVTSVQPLQQSDTQTFVDADDTTERTYCTGSGTPKWTSNAIGLTGGPPYPQATRELSVPTPTTPALTRWASTSRA